jgi:phage baseplate assembly protein W
MAFGSKKISPIDLNKRAALGVNIPFNNLPGYINGSDPLNPVSFSLNEDSTPFESNYTTAEAIKNNLINYFLTNKGERFLNPTFGGGLRSFIFEQINTGNLDFLKERIESDLSLYFSNVIINILDILKEENTNTINISLTYSVPHTDINDTLEMNFT